jgi:cell division protein FtsW
MRAHARPRGERVSSTSASRAAIILLIAIVTLTAIAEQPFVTAVLLPVLTGLFVVYADRWMKARKRISPSIAGRHGIANRFSGLAMATGWRHRSASRSRTASRDARILRTTTLCLFAFGLVMVYSASSRRPGLFVHEPEALRYFLKFVAYGSAGLVLMVVLARDGVRLARRFTAALLFLSFVLVLSTHVPGIGVEINGARRWIGSGSFQFQPSDLMKISLLLYGAELIANRPYRVNDLAELAQPLLLVIGAGCLLVLTQPDLGTAWVITFAVAALLLGAGMQMRMFVAIAVSLAGLILVYALMRPYFQDRLTSFLNPWAHASSSGFQAVQGQIAIGSGGFFGRGLGESIQKAYYLPAASTDSILAVVGEEVGFVGIGTLLFLYSLLAYAGLRIAKSASGLYSSLLAVALTSMIIAQALLNVFSVLGLAPEAGVPLPFISYGYSDLVTMFVAVGLLLNIARKEDSRDRERAGVIPAWVERVPGLIRARIGMLFSFFIVLLVLAGGRSFYLGTVEGASLSRDAAHQQLTNEIVPAPRGPIGDRFGTKLAGSEPAADVSADPYLLGEPQLAASRLAALLSEPVAEVARKLKERIGFVYLARGLPVERVRAILGLDIPGIAASPTTRRTYPRGSLAGQVLGIVGSEDRGMSGLEYAWEKVLRGKAGERRVITNAIGQPISVTQRHRMVPGAPLRLTLDSYVQAEVEYVLDDVAKSCRCRGAAAVVMNPYSGEVLALANWPRVRLGETSALGASELQTDLENRIVGYDIEPGAALDVFTLAGALQEGLATPAQGFVAPARIKLGDAVVEDSTGTQSVVSASQIASGASSTGTLRIASQLGLNRVGRWLRRFGFGAKTNIDLPGEQPGTVPGEVEYDRTSLGKLPIGEGMTVTPIQLAAAYAAIANGGTLRVPHVVADVAGNPVPPAPPLRVLSSTIARSLRQMLAQTAGTGVETSNPTGFGAPRPAARNGIFVGFAPGSHPQVLTVTLVSGQQGASTAKTLAASAYHQITAFLLPYLGTR